MTEKIPAPSGLEPGTARSAGKSYRAPFHKNIPRHICNYVTGP